MMDKSRLRKMSLHYRRILPEAEYKRRNQQLCKRLLDMILENTVQCVHLFMPIARNREPDLRPLLPALWENDRQVMASKTHFAENRMEHFLITAETAFENNSLNIPEPVNAEPVPLQQADWVLVPLVLSDKNGHRIGYGGGYYDRMLKGYEGYALGISLCPPLDELPADPWDRKVNSTLFYRHS